MTNRLHSFLRGDLRVEANGNEIDPRAPVWPLSPQGLESGRETRGQGTCRWEPRYLNSSNFRMCDWKRKRKSPWEGRTTPSQAIRPLEPRITLVYSKGMPGPGVLARQWPAAETPGVGAEGEWPGEIKGQLPPSSKYQ